MCSFFVHHWRSRKAREERSQAQQTIDAYITIVIHTYTDTHTHTQHTSLFCWASREGATSSCHSPFQFPGTRLCVCVVVVFEKKYSERCVTRRGSRRENEHHLRDWVECVFSVLPCFVLFHPGHSLPSSSRSGDVFVLLWIDSQLFSAIVIDATGK